MNETIYSISMEQIIQDKVLTKLALQHINTLFGKAIKTYQGLLKEKRKMDNKYSKKLKTKTYIKKSITQQKHIQKMYVYESKLFNREIEKIRNCFPKIDLFLEQSINKIEKINGEKAKDSEILIEPIEETNSNISITGTWEKPNIDETLIENSNQDLSEKGIHLEFDEKLKYFKSAIKQDDRPQMHHWIRLLFLEHFDKAQDIINSIQNSDCNKNQDEVIFCISDAFRYKQELDSKRNSNRIDINSKSNAA